MLDVLHLERFVDVSPEETWATLLTEGTYLCSARTMYRILAALRGGAPPEPAGVGHRYRSCAAPNSAIVDGHDQAVGTATATVANL